MLGKLNTVSSLKRWINGWSSWSHKLQTLDLRDHLGSQPLGIRVGPFDFYPDFWAFLGFQIAAHLVIRNIASSMATWHRSPQYPTVDFLGQPGHWRVAMLAPLNSHIRLNPQARKTTTQGCIDKKPTFASLCPQCHQCIPGIDRQATWSLCGSTCLFATEKTLGTR